jgi:RHS repeat-associated protein
VSFFGSTKALHGEVAIPSAETSTHNHSNQQYSITAVTTSTGAIAERYAYSAYGEPTICDASGSALNPQLSTLNNRYMYTGREWDATVGLHHFRARWMSPKSGRFMGRDPIQFNGSEWGLYEFVNSKPLILADPDGLVGSTFGVIASRGAPNLTPAQQLACMTKAIKEKEGCEERAFVLCSIICGTWIGGWPTIETIKVIEATNSIPKPSKGCLGRSWGKHYGTAAACFACSYYPRACINDYNCNVKYCTTGKTTFGCGWLITPSF